MSSRARITGYSWAFYQLLQHAELVLCPDPTPHGKEGLATAQKPRSLLNIHTF